MPDHGVDWDEIAAHWYEDETDPPVGPPWRRRILAAIAAVLVVALAAIPLSNILRGPITAPNGLEVCGFDYCIVQDAMRANGLESEMARLWNTFLSDEEAQDLAASILQRVGESDVDVVVVGRLGARIGGMFDPNERIIYLERPVRAWTVLHEVAHAVESGHAEPFRTTLGDLARRFGSDIR